MAGNGTRLNPKFDVVVNVEPADVDPKQWQDIFDEYEAIKALASLINKVSGYNMMYILLETILYNAVNIDDIFFNENFPDWGKVFTVTMYCLTTSAIFLVSADVCEKVSHGKIIKSNLVCIIY